MKCVRGKVSVAKYGDWLSLLATWDGGFGGSLPVFLNPSQMRRLAAMLTRAANRIDAKRKRGAK